MRFAMPAARSSTCWASDPPTARSAPKPIRDHFPDVSYLSLSELFEAPLLTEFSRALTRARVQQYQRYLADADRILILLHNEPDPDAMASGLALRTILHRTQSNGRHRRAGGGDATRERADGEPARYPRGDDLA